MPIYEYKGIRPVLGKDVYVAPNATLIGDVHLGDQCGLWFGAVVRGDVHSIRIGARTNVQDNAVVHVTNDRAATTIGDDVTIGHLAMLHGCTVGNRCLIGMASVVLDHAVIGDECFVAAGTLVTPGTKIPPRSMVMGRPGKAVRPLTPEELAWIDEASRLYVGYAQTFMRDVRVIG